MSLRLAVRLLLFFFLFFGGLYYAKPFLVPIALGALLAMLFVPVSNWLEKKGVGLTLASTICLFGFIGMVAILFFLLGWQVSGLIKDMHGIEQKITGAVQTAQQWIAQTLGIPQDKQEQMLKQQQQSGGSGMSSAIKALPAAIMGMLTDTLLVLVYFFLFLRFRLHLKRFIIKITPEQDRLTAIEVVHKSASSVQKYLTGLTAMIACLWVMYGIGFSIVGVKSALFFAVLCGTLELIPFIGNLTGTALTAIVAMTQGGSNQVIGVLIVYVIVQGLQSYILEPLVVGKQVKVHPMFTIIVIVLGEMVWGIAGMFLSIPLLGMAKIVFDHAPALQPYGYLVGEEENAGDTGMIEEWKLKWRRLIGKEAK